MKGNLVRQWRRICRNFSFTVTGDSERECIKRFCTYCYKNQPSGHFFYVAPLKPSKMTDWILYVLFDTECTQDLEKDAVSFKHIPNLIRAQRMFEM